MFRAPIRVFGRADKFFYDAAKFIARARGWSEAVATIVGLTGAYILFNGRQSKALDALGATLTLLGLTLLIALYASRGYLKLRDYNPAASIPNALDTVDLDAIVKAPLPQLYKFARELDVSELYEFLNERMRYEHRPFYSPLSPTKVDRRQVFRNALHYWHRSIAVWRDQALESPAVEKVSIILPMSTASYALLRDNRIAWTEIPTLLDTPATPTIAVIVTLASREGDPAATMKLLLGAVAHIQGLGLTRLDKVAIVGGDRSRTRLLKRLGFSAVVKLRTGSHLYERAFG